MQDLIRAGNIKSIPSKYMRRVKIVKMVKAGKGLSSLTYILSLICRGNGSRRIGLDLVLKVYNKNGKSICRRESKVLDALYSKGFPVPRLFISEVNNAIFGRPFVIMERINGEPMGEYLKQVGNDERLNIIKRFAETLAFLHSLTWDDLIFLKHSINKFNYADYQAIFVKKALENLKIKSNFEWIIRWIESNAAMQHCQHYSILHGDMHLDNFLVTSDGKIVVLDWEYPEIGDPLKDIALAYVNLIFAFGFRKLNQGRDLGEFFLRQYAKRLNQKMDLLKLRFYIVVSALVEAIFYRFNCRQAFNPFLVIRKLGLKFLIGAPLLSWYFWWRSKILERLIKEEIKCYTLHRRFVNEKN